MDASTSDGSAKSPQQFMKHTIQTLREKLNVFSLREFMEQRWQPLNLISGLAWQMLSECLFGSLYNDFIAIFYFTCHMPQQM